MPGKIILERRSYGWAAWFFGLEYRLSGDAAVRQMPEDVEMPLPFTRDAPLAMVAADIRKRFPAPFLYYRSDLGGLSLVVNYGSLAHAL